MAILGDVFVPGGLPRVTYNPREALNLEEKVRDYLAERHKLLSLSGPTKSGKTVLLKTVVPEALWISGGHIDSADDFWQQLIELLGGYTTVSDEEGDQASRTSEVTAGGGFNVGFAKADAGGKTAAEVGSDTRKVRG